MSQIGNLLNVLKEIDCPVDRFEEKVREAFQDYGLEAGGHIQLERDESLDRDHLLGYRCTPSPSPFADQTPLIAVLVEEGHDHYVKTIVDAYLL